MIMENFSYEINKKLRVISKSLYDDSKQLNALGLLGGRTGLAVFFFEYFQLTRNIKYLNFASKIMSNVLDRIDSFHNYAFASGICGVLWTTQRYINAGLLDEDGDKLLGNFDDTLTEFAIQELEHGRYDYLHHSLGVLLYLIERFQETNNKARVKNAIMRITFQLEKCAVYENTHIKWFDNFSKISSGYEINRYNYGLAHGLPSIISILITLLESGIEDDRINKLIKGACSFVATKKRSAELSKSLFANTSVNEFENSRLAWCYGDLGVGFSLLKAGVVLEDIHLFELGNEIGLHSLFRTHPDDTRVVDACLCHGAAGISMIFRRYFHLTKNHKYLKQSEFWLNHALSMGSQGRGLAGYTFWIEDHMTSNSSLLMGTAGVGLSMISSLSEKTTWWERCLLL